MNLNISNLEDYIVNFFTAYKCKTLHQQDGIIKVQLTEELDKELMNRPFYWHYMNSTGQQGEPMTLTLITNPEKRDTKGEWIHFGSPRLQQIWDYIIEKEKYVLLFQDIQVEKNTPLHPWLLTNIKVSYKGIQKKEELISLGIQLLNGRMVVNMMEELDKIKLKQQISNYCYTLSPIITINSGYKRMESVVLNYIEKQSHDWANEANKTLEEEFAILKHFYHDNQSDELLTKEIEELKNRYEPTIQLEVVNGGMLYLHEGF